MSEGQRRLAAILAADVAGYSRLMGVDEEGTIAALRAHRVDIIDPKLKQFHGRIANTAGDSLLIEFSSAVDALRCAIQVQADIAARNRDIDPDRRLAFRMGLNVGDVIGQGGDLLGDGVNIAARLEGLAEPGGICLSRAARDQVRDRMDLGLEDLGEVKVKNIARPVRVFKMVLAPQPQPQITPADPAKMAYTLPDKPSIAVLPFDNLSGDPAQDYLGDGITENIIAALATSPDLFVIARNSSFTYKGKAVQVQEVAERFGVRYVLEGSVQRAGDWLRVTAQLVNAIDGQHLWAERYDRELDILFALQDEIAQEILVAMDDKLTMGGDANLFWERTKDLETYRLVVQWCSHIQSFSPEGHWEAERLCWEVLQRQPDGVAANSAMAWQYWHKVILELSSEPAADISKSREYAEKAQSYAVAVGVAYSPDTILAQLDILERKYETAIAHAERALERSPADGATTALAGWVKICGGQPEEGVKLMRLAMRTEPDYPQWIPMSLLTGLIMLESFDEAKEVANGLLASRIESAQAHSAAYRALAIMAYHEGNTDDARAYVRKVLELEPKQSVAGLRRAMNLKDRAYVERDLKALAHSGMPE